MRFLGTVWGDLKGGVRGALNTYADLDDCSSGDSEEACRRLEGQLFATLDQFETMQNCGIGRSAAACNTVEEAVGCGDGATAECAGHVTSLVIEASVTHQVGKTILKKCSFTAPTLVVMGDGSTKPIAELF